VQVNIFKQLAKANLGPNLYSAFDEGRFEEYLPSNPLTWEQLTDDSISRVIAEKIAAAHMLNVHELKKKPSWLIDNMRQCFDFVEAHGRNGGLVFSETARQTSRDIAHQMMAIDFNPEIEYLDKLLKNSKLPLVFSHNDLHQNNIILLHDTKLGLDERVVLVDFEYCSYNFLAFDLANHLSEWCFDYNGDSYPNFNFSLARLPSEEKQRQFLTYYIDALDQKLRQQLFDPSLSDSDLMNLLTNEMNIFLMASNLLWCIWAVKSCLTSKIEFGYWEMSKCKWDVYSHCKARQHEDTEM
jgi:choline/ethanolamine kinase